MGFMDSAHVNELLIYNLFLSFDIPLFLPGFCVRTSHTSLIRLRLYTPSFTFR